MTFVNPTDTLSLPRRAEPAASAAERVAQSLLGTQERLFIRRPVIARDANLARAADEGVAYLNDSDQRPKFEELARVIELKAPSRKTRP
jgi:hypothetical protein